jgi:O-antigen ligase
MIVPGARPRMSLESGAFPAVAWATAGATASLAVAAAASISPTIAIGVAVAIAAIVAVVVYPAALPMILAASVFMELVRVEGATISRLLAPVALIVIVIALVRGRGVIQGAAPIYWAGAYLVWAVASGLWTTSVSDTTFLLGSLAIGIVYMLAFASLINSHRDLEHVVWIFAIAALFFGALSLQHFSDVFAWGRVVEEGRSQGGTGDPNSFAATQLVALPLVIALAAAATKRWLQIVLYVAALVIIASILTSLSRGGFIGLAVVLTILVVAPFHLVFRTRRNKAIALLVVALGTAAAVARYSSDVIGRAEGIIQEANPGSSGGSGRINLWLAARSSIEEHPWLGLGYGGFRAESTRLLLDTPGVDLSRYTIRNRGQPVHNSYLEAWTDLGIVGLVLYLGLLVSTGRMLRRMAIHARRVGDFFVGSIAGALLIGLVGYSVISIFISSETARAFWIIIGLSLALPKLVRARQPVQEEEPEPAHP